MATTLPVSHVGSGLEKVIKRHVHGSHHSLSVCQVWTTKINACPRNGWGHVQHQGFAFCVFFQIKWPSFSHLWLHREPKWCAYVCHHVMSLCQVRWKSVHTCPWYGCGRTHGHKNRDQIHKPPFSDQVQRKLIKPSFFLNYFIELREHFEHP